MTSASGIGRMGSSVVGSRRNSAGGYGFVGHAAEVCDVDRGTTALVFGCDGPQAWVVSVPGSVEEVSNRHLDRHGVLDDVCLRLRGDTQEDVFVAVSRADVDHVVIFAAELLDEAERVQLRRLDAILLAYDSF
ncbi:hypothetical protein RPD_2170 [Rhodopseudomonas palustris BisB5]|uniref:Uncharacterized protein n=1 Tax=Rhodopseudomonas palustris (strain BisB5) TaxID=316057 RepID=Q138T4_RHOPS|nr:hypothetical protein RPD_2170 [Rhodopseudomonas palustris BisB5]